MKLNDRELATMLAALRLFQRETGSDDRLEDFRNDNSAIAAIWEEVEDSPLDGAEIDALCERLNTAGE